MNVAVVYKGSSTQIHAFDTLQRSIDTINGTVNVDIVFSDKLRDLRGYEIKVSSGVQFPRIRKINGKLHGNEIYFVNVLLKMQNATYVPIFVNYSNPKTYGEFIKLWSSSKIDLNLNTMNSGGTQVKVQKYYKPFNTFEVIGYCALIPIPSPRLNFYYVFGPFDWMTWMFIMISLAALVIIWCIFKTQQDGQDLNSAGYMVLRVIAGFFGQAISFRHTRWFHLMVIQIFIFMVMVLGSVYQSELISELTVKLNGTRITTIEEMLKTDSKYITDSIFYNTILTHHQELREKFNISKNMLLTNDFRSKSAENFVLIMRCDVAEEIMTMSFPTGNPSEFYYILPEKFFSFYEMLSTTRFSPFVERFEELSLRVLESGIRQHWKTLLRNSIGKLHSNEGLSSNENEYMTMQELKLLFLMWGVGLCVAFITFAAELLCHRYRMHMKNSWIGRTMRKVSLEKKRQKRKRESMIMRRRMQRLRPIIEDATFEMIQCDV